MKHRLERVNEVIKRELSDLIRREFNFTAKLVTVQNVDVTPDLRHAHIHIGVIGTDPERHAAMAQLHDKRRALQGELGKRVILKFTPQLHFALDASIERGTRILNILEDLHLPPEPMANEDGEEDEEDDDEAGEEETEPEDKP